MNDTSSPQRSLTTVQQRKVALDSLTCKYKIALNKNNNLTGVIIIIEKPQTIMKPKDAGQ